MKTTQVTTRILQSSPLLAALLWAAPACATTLYWDPNTNTAGWGTGTGIWGTDSYWTTDSTGGFSDGGINPATTLPWVTTASDALIINQGTNNVTTMSLSGDVHALTLYNNSSNSATTIHTGGNIHLYGVGISSPAFNGNGNALTTINAPIVLEQAAASIVYLGTVGGNQSSTTIAGGITSTNSVNLYFGRMHNTLVSGTVNITGTITGVVPYNNKAEYGVTISADIGSTVTNVEQKGGNGRFLILSGANSYTGTTTATSGILQPTRAAAMPGYDTPAKVVFNGGLLAVPVGGGSDWTTDQVNTLLSNATKTSGALGIDTTSGDLTQWIAFTNDAASLGPVGLTKRGNNVLTLDKVNTYTGVTTVGQGVLRANHGTGLPALSPLNIYRGVFETSTDLVRPAGTAAGEMALDLKIQGGAAPFGGFSARGGPVRICFGTLVLPTTLTWGATMSDVYQGPFNTAQGALLLNAATADNTLEFMNPISLGTATKTVQVDANVATMSGILSSGANGGPIKTGNGTLVLTGGNTYIGVTQINAGVLRATQGVGLPNGSYLKLNGGVYETSGSFTRVNSITAGGANFNWSANNGGFSAHGGKLTVTIGSSAATEQVWVTVNTNNGIRGILKFGSSTANAETEFQNNLDLIGGTRTIDVASGTGGDFATISGLIRDSLATTGALTKTGAGRLVLTNANTYTGQTTVNGGTLALSGAGAISSSIIDIQSNAMLDVSALGGWTVAATQTLKGNGTLAGTTTTSGIVAPGASVGTLSVTGGFTFATGSKLAVEIGTGVAQVETATAVGLPTGDGNVDVTVTGAGIVGSPLILNVPVSYGDDNIAWAGKVRAALAGNAAITALYAVGGSADAITLTRTTLAANDVTLNLALANGTPDPVITPAATSVNTTTGVAATGTDMFAVSGALDISAATLDLSITGTLTAPAYVIASYGNLVPLSGPFFAVTGSPPPSGYTLNYAYNGGTQIALVSSGVSGYTTWATANAGDEPANLDYDKDGVPNGIEYFMGETGSTFTANPSVVGGKITWPYDATATGITYQVLGSSDLANWTPVSPQPVPSGGTLEYTLPTGTPKRFIRLEVVSIP